MTSTTSTSRTVTTIAATTSAEQPRVAERFTAPETRSNASTTAGETCIAYPSACSTRTPPIRAR